MTLRRTTSRRLSGPCALPIALVSFAASAGQVYQPPGSNLTLGDVSHGQRIQSASSNPAAAAADFSRTQQEVVRGTVVSGAAGIEYGNIQEIFDLIDRASASFEPSPPGDGGEELPGQNPGEKPPLGNIVDEIWDSLDPDVKEAIDAVAREVVIQAGLLAVIKAEGYGRAWLSADAPFLLGKERWGGSWTFGFGWTGIAKGFGITEPIDFNRAEAEQRLQDWVDDQDGPTTFEIDRIEVAEDVAVFINEVTGELGFKLTNDSSFATKSTQTSEFSLGYSRPAWSGDAGSLYLGVEARLYLMKLSRLTARFGDITDSEELFQAITDAEFTDDTNLGIDLGALWVGSNYQVGAQVTNINQPLFEFPDLDLSNYNSETVIALIKEDQTYKMDSQVKIEASVWTSNRRWSAHLGYDVDPATDPMGDQYRWATLSGSWSGDNWWIPNVRFGYRTNLAGTQLSYLSAGATIFKYVNIDIASALDTVRISDRNLPMGLMGSIGFQINW